MNEMKRFPVDHPSSGRVLGMASTRREAEKIILAAGIPLHRLDAVELEHGDGRSRWEAYGWHLHAFEDGCSCCNEVQP